MGKERRRGVRLIHLLLVAVFLVAACLRIPEELARGSPEQLQDARSLTAPPGKARLYVFPCIRRETALGMVSDQEMYVETTLLVTDTAIATVHIESFVVLDIPPGTYKITYFSDDPKPEPMSIELKDGQIEFIRPVDSSFQPNIYPMGAGGLIGGLVVEGISAAAKPSSFKEGRYVERCPEQCKPLIGEYTLLNTGEVFDFDKQ